MLQVVEAVDGDGVSRRPIHQDAGSQHKLRSSWLLLPSLTGLC